MEDLKDLIKNILKNHNRFYSDLPDELNLEHKVESKMHETYLAFVKLNLIHTC